MFQATIWLKHPILWKGQTTNGSKMDFSNVLVDVHFILKVNRTQAQADTCTVRSSKGRDGGACRADGGGLNSCWFQDKLTLNSSTSSSCKREAWRLKRDLETSSGGLGGGQDYVDVMPQITNSNDDWRWEDTWHRTSPHINLHSVCLCMFVWWPMRENSSLWHLLKNSLSYLIWQIESSLRKNTSSDIL